MIISRGGNIIMLKDKIKERIFWREKYNKDPEELTEAEQWVKGKLENLDRTYRFSIFKGLGRRYSMRFFRTHTAEEAYEQWLDEVERLCEFLDNLKERNMMSEEEKKAADEKAAAEKAAAKKAAREEWKRKLKLKRKIK